MREALEYLYINNTKRKSNNFRNKNGGCAGTTP